MADVESNNSSDAESDISAEFSEEESRVKTRSVRKFTKMATDVATDRVATKPRARAQTQRGKTAEKTSQDGGSREEAVGSKPDQHGGARGSAAVAKTGQDGDARGDAAATKVSKDGGLKCGVAAPKIRVVQDVLVRRRDDEDAPSGNESSDGSVTDKRGGKITKAERQLYKQVQANRSCDVLEAHDAYNEARKAVQTLRLKSRAQDHQGLLNLLEDAHVTMITKLERVATRMEDAVARLDYLQEKLCESALTGGNDDEGWNEVGKGGRVLDAKQTQRIEPTKRSYADTAKTTKAAGKAKATKLTLADRINVSKAAQALKENLPVVLIKDVKGVLNTGVVRNKVISGLRPALAGLKVKTTRSARNGVVLELESVEDANKLLKATGICKNMGLVATAPKGTRPKIIVRNFYTECSDDEIIDEIAACNDMPAGFADTAKVVWRAKNGTTVIECEENAREILVNGVFTAFWHRYTAKNYVSVQRCFRCLGFDHRVNECTAKVASCNRCGYEGHLASECKVKDKDLECINCWRMERNCKHRALTDACPLYVRERNKRVKRVNYVASVECMKND
ncbi:PREDICTED: uncharacterized protein LOC108564523 [Nicrophorus vespilloides]|uniref:Uncharacterized protein LOC108564523 n=1 Tax=Nicrophorus vespilloides TaxID=110193 RepID=A0ABM1MWX9_NICVS|nr:PREDICTED: uncharacterized protein LOC108564523 [Nicrophorus vespilloides]